MPEQFMPHLKNPQDVGPAHGRSEQGAESGHGSAHACCPGRCQQNLLDPQSSARGKAPVQAPGTRKPRELKTYKNPHTGEVVETKGGNHKTLKEWKTKHGSDMVESWLKK
ncbi:hypothetical protein EDF87_118105 [Pseudomonas helmanticensis]|uniref:MvaT DNA-binding domain-containing protein n=1 Tax=Pseudomonas helmanticensis TaxID=1471381 RepID=A0A4R7UVY6_9PSED|nr:histone-like nucleoid-structuring protein, MvaT/MvaU family [Pseudomonas helmanticensis]TDV40909.1 hypothetical protein EDF87_118105 [Pseudomonas helmanticensis]